MSYYLFNSLPCFYLRVPYFGTALVAVTSCPLLRHSVSSLTLWRFGEGSPSLFWIFLFFFVSNHIIPVFPSASPRGKLGSKPQNVAFLHFLKSIRTDRNHSKPCVVVDLFGTLFGF